MLINHKFQNYYLELNVTPLIRRGSLCSTLLLNLMPCLSSRLEIIACLHSQGRREAIRTEISRREDKRGIQFKAGANYLTLFEGKTLFNKLWPLLDLRAKLDMKSTNDNESQRN